jgi:uncharacterized membrane protein YidH (DUF202 family)
MPASNVTLQSPYNRNMSFLRRLRTPVYQNTGSTARDHLASERTYLSWLRTGLGFIALGIAIERFNQLDLSTLLQPPVRQYASDSTSMTSASLSQANDAPARKSSETGVKPKDHRLVGSLLGTGLGSIVYGTSRYFSNMRMLEQGLFKPAYFGAMGLSVTVAGVAGMVYVEALKEQLREKDEDEDVCRRPSGWEKKTERQERR